MEIMTAIVPFRIANLLVAYFCHTATEEQRYELDEWISSSNDNMRMFGNCVESSLAPFQPDPDRDEETVFEYPVVLN